MTARSVCYGKGSPATGLTATQIAKNQISLRWTDVSGNEAGFKIERSTNNATWAQVATVGANVTTYRDAGLKQNTRYYYRVLAYNSAGNSAYSNTAYPGGTIAAASATPTTASLFSRNSIDVTNELDTVSA